MTKVAYLMSRFPHLPETFILREMSEMERQGHNVVLYPLILQKQSVTHAEARAWLPRAKRLPYLSPQILTGAARLAVRYPGRTTSVIFHAFEENLSNPGFLIRAIALLPKAFAAAQEMQAEGVEHIHAHYATHPAFVAWVIHRLTGIPYSVTVHAHDIFVHKTMLATKLRQASFIAAISEFNREYLAREVGNWIKDTTYVIHCGIDPHTYHPRQHARDNHDPLKIIHIGSLQDYKGQKHLIAACSLLRQRDIPFTCQIVGEGKLQANLQKQIDQIGLTPWVKLLGPQPQEVVAGLLRQADCYVQPSIITQAGKMEGIPVALMEALACELPVIATAISGIPELVQPRRTGYLVVPEDPEPLANAIWEVYAHPEEAARLAAEGRRKVLKDFNLQANVKALACLIDKPAGLGLANRSSRSAVLGTHL